MLSAMFSMELSPGISYIAMPIMKIERLTVILSAIMIGLDYI